jgi:Tfp pilus assembly protein PilF
VGSELFSRRVERKNQNIAEKLLALDSKRAEGHNALAILKFIEWRWREAETGFKRAIELNNKYADAHAWYGWFLTSERRFDQAKQEMKRAEEIDPTSLNIKVASGWPFYAEGKFEEALVRFERVLEMEPNSIGAHFWLKHAFEAKGDYAKAILHAEKFDVLAGGNAPALAERYGRLRRAATESGSAGYWQARLEHFPEGPFWTARIYAHLGDTSNALQNLERAYAEQPVHMIWLGLSDWDIVRADARFRALAEKIGLKE